MHGFFGFFWFFFLEGEGGGGFHRLWKSSAFVIFVFGVVRRNRDVVVHVCT
jgi:hypothetical protein